MGSPRTSLMEPNTPESYGPQGRGMAHHGKHRSGEVIASYHQAAPLRESGNPGHRQAEKRKGEKYQPKLIKR